MDCKDTTLSVVHLQSGILLKNIAEQVGYHDQIKRIQRTLPQHIYEKNVLLMIIFGHISLA